MAEKIIYQTGLCLSGGGARGIAHIGALKALEEVEMKPDVLSGTSSGAIVAALYCAGHSPQKIFDLLSKLKYLQVFDPAIFSKGLFTLAKVEKILATQLPEKFEDLQKPLFVNCTNIENGSVRYFSEGKLIKVLIAACSIPVIFQPVTIAGNVYVDGGLTDNMPVKILKPQCRQVVGINTNFTETNFKVQNYKKILERSLMILVNQNQLESRRLCDILIESPRISVLSTLSFRQAERLYQIGYQVAKQKVLRC